MNPLEWLRQAGSATESDSDRDGFLSYASETHAVGHGLYDGLTSSKPLANKLPDNKDVQAEKHYYKGAFVLGTLIQIVVLVTLAMFGL